MKNFLKILFFGGALLTWVGLIVWFTAGDNFKRNLKEKQAEVVGRAAGVYIANNSAQKNPDSQVKTVAGLHHIEVAIDKFQDNIYRASGVANSYLIRTNSGNVLFDGGLATQAVSQKKLLQEAAPGELKYIILSHSHADHYGATKFWKAEFPNAQIITHRRFAAGFKYLEDLQDHFWDRNRLLYTFMPESPPANDSLFSNHGLFADIMVDDFAEHEFELGGVTFRVIPAPGAEGDDNIVLWLPQQKALFSGDVFGPLFPMLPNLFTLRGEKFRDPLNYIQSLNTLIRLQPEMVLPSHFDPIEDADQLESDLTAMRDATLYMHDQTIAGMNAGKSVWELMRDIKLPDELGISQGHGKLSWNVRSIWEHYSTWFKYESTTELYSVQVDQLYPEIAQMAGSADILVANAAQSLNEGELEKALHWIEIALAGHTNHIPALEVRLQTLDAMLKRAHQDGSNFSETGWLGRRIDITREQIKSNK
jgi:alkyl sulfatase BDS1-like metallo-beta-lactamase superfamily hydrolase